MDEHVRVISNDLIVVGPCTIGTPRGGFDKLGTAEFAVFLCPDCDKVHVHFSSPELAGGQLQFNASLDQEEVDKFIRLLDNPQVAF